MMTMVMSFGIATMNSMSDIVHNVRSYNIFPRVNTNAIM